MSTEEARQIPIDIHLGQLLDWLISRRHCTKDWHANLQKIRERLNIFYPTLLEGTGIKDTLEKGNTPLVSSEALYIHLQETAQILSETEHGAKNMLGQYQSPVMKELMEIIKSYEKDNIYLAELAQSIYRNITYDIPFIKKQMQKLDQSAAECAKKADDNARSANEFREQYLKECTALGIKGERVREELLQGAKLLPTLYENIASRVGVLAPVCKYVEEFIVIVHKGGWIKDQSGPNLFPLLHHLMKHGNSPYPFEEAVAVEDTKTNAQVMDTAPRYGAQDDTESSQESLNVNLNDTIADHLNELSSTSIETIDFDVVEGMDEDTEEVNWDMETEGLSITVEDGGDSLFRNVLDNPELRTQVVNELHELLAFLKGRAEEQSVEHLASELLNIQVGDSRLIGDKKMVQQMIGNVREILALFDHHRLQSLCKLHDSATFLDRLTKQLEQKLTFCSRMEHRGEAFRAHRLEALDERRGLDPELVKLIDATRSYQKFIEHAISKKYQDRRVSILGGVQSVL